MNLLAVTALLISYLAVYIPPDKFWVPSFFGLAYPIILVVNLFFMFFWVFVRARFLLLSLVTILIGAGFINRYVQFGGRNVPAEGIKVISFNVQNFAGNTLAEKSVSAGRIIDFLKDEKADIICLQDLTLRKTDIFNITNVVKSLESIKHFQYATSGPTFGLATFTRYPIIKMGEIRYGKSPNMAIYTDVIIESDTVRVFNLHLQSYKIDPRKYAIIDSPSITQEEDLREIREIGGKLKRAFRLRAVQVREIRKVMDETRYPMIVCGDFNDTPVSYTYQKIRSGLKDAFIGSGNGFGQTYNGKLPSYRIDNIFHSSTFKSHNFRVNDFRASDHLPVSCILEKK